MENSAQGKIQESITRNTCKVSTQLNDDYFMECHRLMVYA